MAERRGDRPRSVEPRGAPLPGRTTYLHSPEPVPRWTSGRECWVFRADSPDELCGYHPQLVRSALPPGEAFEYLLYSPLFEGGDGPFRAGGGPGSHAVGITPHRFVVSRDPHAGGTPRSVTTLDRDDVWCVQIGCALLLGWLVIRVGGEQGAQGYTIPFSSRGMSHFRALARAYRARGPERSAAGGPRVGWDEAWAGTPPYLRSELEPLTGEGERPLALLRSPERWTAQRGFWRRRSLCTSAPGLLVVTSRGALWAASEPRMRPEGLAFGVKVTVVRPERLAGATIGVRDGLGVLRLRAGEGAHSHELEVLFDGNDVGQAEEIVRLVREWRGWP